MKAFCWHCAEEIQDLPKQIPFRLTCPHCDTYLHCCSNCSHYQPGRSNDCKIPGTDWVADRQGINFCEDFVLLGKASPPKKSHLDNVSKRLFGE
ncbi:Uncharacterized protein PHSC3_000870 [Chlamydiales bacterium STE3]|nr:Uncharacterized protein PHSC3_000870 [Chlamydiales bacterium STE3]